MSLGDLEARIRVKSMDEVVKRVEAAKDLIEEAKNIKLDIQAVAKMGAN